MIPQIKTAFNHLFVKGDPSTHDGLVVFLVFTPVIIFFVVEVLLTHIKY